MLRTIQVQLCNMTIWELKIKERSNTQDLYWLILSQWLHPVFLINKQRKFTNHTQLYTLYNQDTFFHHVETQLCSYLLPYILQFHIHCIHTSQQCYKPL